MMDESLHKIHILIQQKRFADAERALKDLMADDASNVDLLALLAEVKLQQGNTEHARAIIDQAIGIAPDFPYLFYMKSRIALQQEHVGEALENIQQAIELDPYDADYFALSANITLSRKQYEKALELANKALEIDPENILGLNSRSTALLKLNKHEESFNTIEGALREDPANAYTHANYGWGLLEKGDHRKALEHFKESLKNDPNFTYAQSGMLEALKASNPVYKLFLRYAFWIGNLTSKYQWGVIIGFYIGVRVLRALADSNETLRPFLFPLIIALALIAFSTWVITPVGNLFLRFNKYGQFLLDANEKKSSNFVAASFLLFLMGVALYFITKDDKFLSITVFGFAMMLPFGIMFSPAKYKSTLLIYTIVIAVVGIFAIGLTFSTGLLLNVMSMLFVIGFVAFQWVANFLVIKESNR